ncbi:MAG: recombinase family protein [Spirochaetales bacterium]
MLTTGSIIITRVGYVRVSTEDQVLDRQMDLMSSLGIEKIFSDKASGKSQSRPGLKALLEYVREGDEVVVESISRLARSTKDLLEIVDTLTAKKVRFRSLKESLDSSTPQGNFVLTIFAALGQLERESILERQCEGIASAKSRGKHLGRPQLQVPSNWSSVYRQWKNGELTAVEAMKATNLTKSSFYKLARRHQR